jgi:hypothetical protein
MEKLFLFRVSDIDSSSALFHASGTNVDCVAIPARKLSSIRCGENKIYLYFDSAGKYDQQWDHDGFVNLPKTKVELTTREDQEVKAINGIISDLNNPNVTTITFDVVRTSYSTNAVTGVTSISDQATDES